jgi:FMN-dependent NADH-azoreductase
MDTGDTLMQDKKGQASLKVLEITASGRNDGSVSRMLSADLVGALEERHGSIELTRRDLSRGLALVDEAWINANFTAAEERSAEQRAALAESDALVDELKAADVLVIGAPIYNFGIPATLKAWIDMVARARLTFRYTENGPQGLLEGKKAYVIVASGGVPVDSAVDFATPYLRHALGFIGITDIDVIAADRLNSRAEESIDAARVRIAELIHTAPRIDARVA